MSKSISTQCDLPTGQEKQNWAHLQKKKTTFQQILKPSMPKCFHICGYTAKGAENDLLCVMTHHVADTCKPDLANKAKTWPSFIEEEPNMVTFSPRSVHGSKRVTRLHFTMTDPVTITCIADTPHWSLLTCILSTSLAAERSMKRLGESETHTHTQCPRKMVWPSCWMHQIFLNPFGVRLSLNPDHLPLPITCLPAVTGSGSTCRLSSLTLWPKQIKQSDRFIKTQKHKSLSSFHWANGCNCSCRPARLARRWAGVETLRHYNPKSHKNLRALWFSVVWEHKMSDWVGVYPSLVCPFPCLAFSELCHLY